jgi:AcrR family transcriptional regulator
MVIRTGKAKIDEDQPSPQLSRGRPRRTSRDAIIDAAVALLRANPEAPLSLNATARALNVTPMAIYTYFASKDDLQQAVTEALFREFKVKTPKSTTPLEKIVSWAHAMRRHFLERPELINLLIWEGGHVSVGWLERSAVIVDAVSEMGFSEHETGEITLWIWQVVMGGINSELHALRTRPMVISQEELENLDEALRRRVNLVRRFGEQVNFSDDFFTYQIDRMVDALKVLAEKRKRAK